MPRILFRGVFLLLLVQIFGVGSNEVELPSVDRIVDGSPIDITQVPYMLSYMANGNHVCGAAIIKEEWGLTAAHCVLPFIDVPTEHVSVRSGSSEHDYGGVVHNVTLLIPHEKYNDSNNDYDIAVFKVDPPFDYNNATQPVKLPEDPAHVDTSWGLVAGWGYFIVNDLPYYDLRVTLNRETWNQWTESDPVLSETLQYVIVPKVNETMCARDYEGRFDITDHQVCYGFSQGGRDSCKGDSGGPLVSNFTAIGLTSWGVDCGLPRSPGVYTDVISLVGWIRNKTESAS